MAIQYDYPVSSWYTVVREKKKSNGNKDLYGTGSNTDNTLHHAHDKGYKYLLSAKETFMELLRSFLDADWVQEIDESDLVCLDKSYVLPDFQKQEADLVYQVRLKDQDIIVYMLVEMQSSVDFQMPWRLLMYMTEIWRDILKNTDEGQRSQKSFRLPCIVPVVLYNGRQNWTARRRFKETLAGSHLFGDLVLDFSYILFDVNRIDEEELFALQNLIGSVFYLDQHQNAEQFMDRFRRLAHHLDRFDTHTYQRFATWAKGIMGRRLPKEQRQQMTTMLSEAEEEGDPMLTNVEKTLDKMFAEATRKGLAEGKATGKAQGIAEGRTEGKAEGKAEGKLEVACKLVAKGISVEEVAELTELDPEEITKYCA